MIYISISKEWWRCFIVSKLHNISYITRGKNLMITAINRSDWGNQLDSEGGDDAKTWAQISTSTEVSDPKESVHAEIFSSFAEGDGIGWLPYVTGNGISMYLFSEKLPKKWNRIINNPFNTIPKRLDVLAGRFNVISRSFLGREKHVSPEETTKKWEVISARNGCFSVVSCPRVDRKTKKKKLKYKRNKK